MVLHDSLSRRKQELPPPRPIRMYVRGPTVYQWIHVGNARPYIVFIWLKRWLEQRGYDVTLVENVTDPDDKIYEAAEKQGIGSDELAAAATQWYVEDTDDLGLGRPDHEPLASETIPEIVALIEELIGRGLESQGDVYFRVAAYPSYGELSGTKLGRRSASSRRRGTCARGRSSRLLWTTTSTRRWRSRSSTPGALPASSACWSVPRDLRARGRCHRRGSSRGDRARPGAPGRACGAGIRPGG